MQDHVLTRMAGTAHDLLHLHHTLTDTSSSAHMIVCLIIMYNLRNSHSLPSCMHCQASLANVKRRLIMNTLLSGWGGGKGVYSFFSRFFWGFFLLLRFFDLNFGRNLSHDSFFRFGSLASSFFIIRV